MTAAPSKHVLEVRPIGRVENHVEPGQHVIWERVDSRVVIDDQWADGLAGVEGFSHVIVLFWLDSPEEQDVPLKVHPQARADMPLVGVFATRSPHRPNPIAVTTVRLLRRQGNVLHVRGLDAFNGTPVLDIKPYLTRGDRKTRATVPPWLHRLWESKCDPAKR
jgi:tRNA-Thr(GGU) m(6)t(6)A37 methyltransferase TsaA